MSNEEKVESLVCRAFQMYTGTPFAGTENPFPMYSFDKPARSFWRGFIEGLLELDATEDEVEHILRSKNMRWMFDQRAEEVEAFGKTFVNEKFIKWSRDN